MFLNIENRIAEIILDNPKAGNSVGIEEAKQLERILNQITKNKNLIGILIRSNSPKLFCAGGNLDEQTQIKTKAVGLRYHRQIRKTLSLLSQTELPIVALVEGLCLGGGTELVSCADHIVATPSALFGFWQRRIGLTFGWGGGSRLFNRVSLHQLRTWLRSAQNLTALAALQAGLIDEVVPSWAAVARAKAWLLASSDARFTNDSISGLAKKWTPKNEKSFFEKLLWTGAHLSALKARKKLDR